MKLRYGLLAAAAILLLTSMAPRAAFASCIAISKDSTFVDCRAIIAPPFMLGQIYVVAALFGDAANDGITGAEFRIQDFPATWFPSATPNSAGTSIGDPFGAGCNITFPSCQNTPSYTVLLYTLTYLPTDAGVHNTNVVAASPPSNPQFDCPVMTLCDTPLFTQLCVTGGYFRFNDKGPCELAIEQARWGEVKALFQ